MSTVISVRIKEELEKHGIDISKEVWKFLEELYIKVRAKEYVNKWVKELKYVKPSEKGFSIKSVREDRESHWFVFPSKIFSKEEGWEKVDQIIEEGVINPDLSVKEVANALWKKILMGEMNEDFAIKILYDLLKREAIIIVNQDEYLIEAFKTANRNKITIYEFLFISLAKSINLELVTSDIKQYEIAKNEGVNAHLI